MKTEFFFFFCHQMMNCCCEYSLVWWIAERAEQYNRKQWSI